MATRSQKAFTLCILLFTITCAFTVFVPTLNAQPHLDWVRRYSLNPAQTNQTKTLALSKDGGLIVAGSSYAPLDQNDLDYYVVKYNPGGDTAWSLRFNSFDTLHDVVRAMTLDTNGNIYVTGTSDTIAISPTGQLLWDTNIPGKAIAADSTNALYVVGSSETDLATWRLDITTGAPVWTRTQDGGFSRPDTAEQVAVDKNGNVYTVGAVTSNCAGSRPLCIQGIGIVRYSPSGAQLSFQAVRTLYGSTSAAASRFDQNGRLLTLHNTSSSSFLWFWLNSDGSIQDGDYGLQKGILGTAMVLDSDGSAFLTGQQAVYIASLHNFRAATVKIDGNGKIIWQSFYPTDPTGQTLGTGIAIDADKNIFVCGQTTNTVTGNDIFLIKYDPSGVQQWIQFYDGPAHLDDTATGIIVTNRSIYITGYSQTAQGGTELVTLKYSQPATATIARQPSGSIRINFLTAPNAPYILQATTNYFDWTSVLTNTADPTGLVQFEDPAPTLPLRLYRGLKPQ